MKKDRRVRRTRKALQDAYIRLMEKYDDHEITISMITDEADINRATFYTHFSNKEEFLEEMLYDLLAGLEEAILSAFDKKKKITNDRITPTTKEIFQYFEDKKEVFYALSKGHGDFSKRLETLFHRLFTEKIYIQTQSPLGKINYDIYIHYQTKATLGLLQYWVNSNFGYSKEYMMEQLTLLSNIQITSLELRGR